MEIEWIPCSEKLPERFQKVIVCREIEKGVYIVEQGYKDVGDWWKVYESVRYQDEEGHSLDADAPAAGGGKPWNTLMYQNA